MVNFSTRSLAAFERPERRLAGRLDAAIGAIRSRRGIGGLRDKRVVLVTADTWPACVNQVAFRPSCRRDDRFFPAGWEVHLGFSPVDGKVLDAMQSIDDHGPRAMGGGGFRP